VVLDVAKLTPGREDYYLERLADNREEYLSGHGESPGRWYGQGAARLGLDGEASKEGFRRLIQGRHPATGELLGREHARHAVTGFDLVLRPAKSVSVLYGLGDAVTGRAVLEAHHLGLAEATAYLDGHLGARRGHGGAEHVGGAGLLAVGFDHRTWWWPTGCRARTAGGPPWTAGTSTGTAAPPTRSTGLRSSGS
jgi:conjugative relaxase-like TrwC/TraI family protein